jgi:SsrA-binding protein
VNKDRMVSVNRRAFHDYLILETLEAGLALTGTEIKSLRQGRVSLKEGYVRPEGGEMWLEGVTIPPYEAGGPYNHTPTRPRKLLLHREQIDALVSQVSTKGYTLVPLKLYFKKGWAKIEVGLATGKKLYDKRRAIKEREAEREVERAFKGEKGRP